MSDIPRSREFIIAEIAHEWASRLPKGRNAVSVDERGPEVDPETGELHHVIVIHSVTKTATEEKQG